MCEGSRTNKVRVIFGVSPDVTFDLLNRLVSVQCNFSETLSCEIFGDRMGSHLFDKFVKAENNILYLFNSMDTSNKSILIQYLAD